MDAPYTSGRLSSSIALIGEAPGREEELAGGAFVGSAGRLLNELLHQAGISRSDVYIDNVFQVRPPGNDVSIWLDLRKRNPETPQYQAAKAALLERLALCPANILIPLGNVPLYALTGKLAITKQRGSLLLSEDGRKVLPTVHPSAALREYMLRYLIVADLKRAKGQSGTPELKLLERTFVLEPSHEEALGFLRQAMSYPTVAYDIETRGLEMSHISVAVSPTQVICIPFLVGNDNYWTPEQELEILYALQDLLEAPDVTKVGQNLSFDATFLYSKYGFITRPFEDTMIAQGILYPDLPKGLDFLTSLYCNGEPYYKDDGKTWMRNPFGSDLAFRRYNAMDSAVLMEIWPQQREELVKGGNFQTYERQRNLLLPLVFAGSRGIRMDLKGLTGAAQTCTQNIEALQKELNELAGEAINANSPKQIQTYFYVKRRLRPHTKEGRVTTDDKALRMIAAAGHKEAQLILDLRHEQKMLSTYYGVQLDPDGRLRCSFNPVGTAQGRVSSSKTIRGTGMNLQNQPEDMNNLMIADPGHILVNQDLGQAENRVVAYVSGEPMMMQAFENGVDIHKQTAALIHGIMMDEVTPDQRQDGKTANHCKLRSCQVLTPKGWLPIDVAYAQGERLAQWEHNGSISFASPTAWFCNPSYTGEVATFTGHFIHQEMTPEHRIPCRRRQGKDKGKIVDYTAQDLPLTSSWEWPTSGTKTDGDVDLPELIIRLLVAFQADGTWSGNCPTWKLKNPGKVYRLRAILSALQVTYTEHSQGEYTSILIRTENIERDILWKVFPRQKVWPTYFLHLTYNGLQAFCDEVVRWDGDGSVYWTSLVDNAILVQTMFHFIGQKAFVGWACKETGTYRVSPSEKAETRMDIVTRSIRTVVEEPIYCPSVPSGYFLCREEGVISVTGNSLNYDEGPDGFARIHLLPLQKARFIYTRYHEVYPGIHEWHQTVRSTLAEKGRTLTNCFGRRRTFMDRWGPDLFKVAYSYIPQSTVADLMNQAGYTYLYYRQDLFPEVVFLNTIHDSIRYEIPLEAGIPRILEIVGLLKKSLEATLTWQGREFSIPVDTAFGFTFDKKKMMEWKASKVAATAPEALEGELSDYVEKNRRLD